MYYFILKSYYFFDPPTNCKICVLLHIAIAAYNFMLNHGRDRMVVGLQLPVKSVSITTKVVSLNPVHGEVYLIQYYMIKFVGDL
jgi:hypothetical protein